MVFILVWNASFVPIVLLLKYTAAGKLSYAYRHIYQSASLYLNPTEHVFHSLKAKRPQNKQEMNMATEQAWQSNTREHAKCLLMSVDHRFQTVTQCKGFATKYLI